MGAFTTSKSFKAKHQFIPYAIGLLKKKYQAQGFEFSEESVDFDYTEITMTKGKFLHNVVGLKQGLKIRFVLNGDDIEVIASGTVLKNQAVATACTLLVTSVTIVPQVIGMVRQSKLDKEVINDISMIYTTYMADKPCFCSKCGTLIKSGQTECPKCKTTLS